MPNPNRPTFFLHATMHGPKSQPRTGHTREPDPTHNELKHTITRMEAMVGTLCVDSTDPFSKFVSVVEPLPSLSSSDDVNVTYVNGAPVPAPTVQEERERQLAAVGNRF